MQLRQHDTEVLEKLNGAGWVSQHQLKTSRQTLNKLLRAKLVERRIGGKPIRYLPETGAQFRLKQQEQNTNGTSQSKS